MFLIYLLVQTAESSWLSKTAKKLENSAKKRISEGIAIAIKGGSRRRRSVGEEDAIPSHIEVNKFFLRKPAKEHI
uniref:Cecropin-P3 n=2 Tax=Ascaris TaxID=6251 RepID=CECP3_ASCSU|nr:RecName: Full=Cecropin-P3; Flags: Precursor [Ascaris suum]BAD89087.1 cecropin P3 [Ascaris suum]BAD89091.1 cecropin P3 [Ascaris suum]